MNILLLIANILTFCACLIHTFVGDREIKLLRPTQDPDPDIKQVEVWTMARCGWHWVSYDLLLASLGMSIINFTDLLDNETQLLYILSIYFFGYAFVWLLVIIFTRSFPGNFVKLGQWMLLLLIGGLTYLAI